MQQLKLLKQIITAPPDWWIVYESEDHHPVYEPVMALGIFTLKDEYAPPHKGWQKVGIECNPLDKLSLEVTDENDFIGYYRNPEPHGLGEMSRHRFVQMGRRNAPKTWFKRE